MGRQCIRVGSGAGFADDRIDAAGHLVRNVDLDYLVMECLAERTIARETLARRANPEAGYTPSLVERMEEVLPACLAKGIRIVTNMGAANPSGAARMVAQMSEARDAGLRRIAVLEGDDVADILRLHPELPLMEDHHPLEHLLPDMISANAYLGADSVAMALAAEADVVLTGRVADPSLFVGCMMHGMGWDYGDYERLAEATMAGHLLECGAQVCGGCFADPGKKHVADLAHLGLPYAEVAAGEPIRLRKAQQSGGRLDIATCTEQALYEIHDPAAYVTPDCVLDLSGLQLFQDGPDTVVLNGVTAGERPDAYKVTVGYDAGWMGEGEIGYAGPNALARAKVSAELVRARLQEQGHVFVDLRVDLIGLTSLHGDYRQGPEPYEVRLRVSGRTHARKSAAALGFEMKTLNVNGPAGGGGTWSAVREVVGVKSVLIPRSWVRPHVRVVEVRA